ncbi:MAG TPA: hypothetical protein GX700_08035 [Paracoccus sp.]|nr:hypothetical protein [Paracoccus sp. (in: a-proteobacteria)]
MKSAFGIAILTCTALAHPVAAQVLDDGYGPDAWQVVGVSPGDVLNVRMGPDTAYPVTGNFARDARGLRQETCVPLMTMAQSMALSDAQRAALPPRWCLMHDADRRTRGWVNAGYLAEDGSVAVSRPSVTNADLVDQTLTGQIAAAEALVRELYRAHAMALRGGGQSPLLLPRAREFFSDNVARQIDPARVGADPLYDGQDYEISSLRIAADPDQPAFRGMITIHADFLNFGQPRRVSFSLRPDTMRAGNPLLIFRVEYEEGEIW